MYRKVSGSRDAQLAQASFTYRVSTALGWFIGTAIALTACTGKIGEPDEGKLWLNPDASDGGSKDPGGSDDPKGNGAASCTGAVAAPAPLARLTNLEYRNTLETLFPGMSMPDVDLPSDIVVEGFDNNAKAQTPAPALIEQYRVSAQAIGAAVSTQLGSFLPCKATSSAEQDSCGKMWIDSFAPRAFRRPITSDERTRLNALFSSAKSSYDFPTAVNMVVQAVLQSPFFLYRVEQGGPAKNGIAPLTGYEMASRLSYFFWDNMPDDALMAAAASGALDNADGVEDQARRLLDDAKAKQAVANIFSQWLRFEKMDRMVKDKSVFPNWNDQMADTLRASTVKFVDHVFWEMDGSLDALLTDTSVYVDAQTAPIYGLPASTATASAGQLTLAQANSDQRSGILTQAGLLAAFGKETRDSPVLRGVFVLDRLLCAPPPPPPANVSGSVTEQSGAMPRTTRELFAMTHEQGECATCHHAIDGYGFGFSHYDAVGAWREKENNIPVDASGWTPNDQKFDGAVELGQILADSQQVSDCVASQWFRYSLGLGAADVDRCDVAPVKKTFDDSTHDLRELMIATVTSQAFRNRAEVTE